MKKYLSVILVMLAGCNHSSDLKPEDTKVSRSAYMQEEINKILAKDKSNKLIELEHLEQIRIAQENNDTEAFEFFFQEYVEVERLYIPEELKKEPNSGMASPLFR